MVDVTIMNTPTTMQAWYQQLNNISMYILPALLRTYKSKYLFYKDD